MKPRFCPKCNSPVNNNAVVCTNCGEKLEAPPKWYTKNGAIITLLILFFPVGLYLMWKYSKWHIAAKVIISIIFAALVLNSILNSNGNNNSQPSNSSSVTSSAATASDTSSSAPSSDKKTSTDSGTLGKYEVTIKDATLTRDYEGNPAMIVTFSYKNNSDKAQSFSTSVHDIAYQDGVQLSTGIILQSDNATYEAGDSLKNVQPGTTIDIQQAYKLSNTSSPVQVEVNELFSFSNEKLTKTFDTASLPNN